MSATAKQIKFCDDLIHNGAPFEYKNPHEDSVEAADAFIKKNYHFGRKTEAYYAAVLRNNPDMCPEDYGVFNH